MYRLVNEYSQLLERRQKIETALDSCAKGYISEKIINGKRYSYLQVKINGKLTSSYLKADEVDKVQSQLVQRKQYEANLPQIAVRLEQLEQAAKIIGNGLDRTLLLLRLSVGMDEMKPAQKEQCIRFANTMNAIEGVAVSQKTAEEIAHWQRGEKTYQAVFAATLRRYGFPVEV